MSVNDKVRQVRNSQKLSQSEFGRILGVKNAAISKIEKGERNLTEQMALSICREFKVNYAWLIEGKGEMFNDLPETIVDELVKAYALDSLDKKLISNYLELSKDKKEIIKNYLKSVF